MWLESFSMWLPMRSRLSDIESAVEINDCEILWHLTIVTFDEKGASLRR